MLPFRIIQLTVLTVIKYIIATLKAGCRLIIGVEAITEVCKLPITVLCRLIVNNIIDYIQHFGLSGVAC